MGSLLRRRPNAFNLVHQLEFLERTGMSKDLTLKTLEASCKNVQFDSAIYF